MRGHQPARVGRVERVRIDCDIYQRIERMQVGSRRHRLIRPDIARCEDRLALKVRLVHGVVVDDADRPDARGRQVLQRRRTESARAYDEQPRRSEPFLAAQPDLWNKQVPAIAAQFARVHSATASRRSAAGCCFSNHSKTATRECSAAYV